MREIDVTKVSAIEYLEKFVRIRKEEICNEGVDCQSCKYGDVSCIPRYGIINMNIKDHIQRVMEFKLPEPNIDWSKVEKDTLIEVSDDCEKWHKRYFAMCEYGKVYAYLDGCTSKTTNQISPWEYARLVLGDD